MSLFQYRYATGVVKANKHLVIWMGIVSFLFLSGCAVTGGGPVQLRTALLSAPIDGDAGPETPASFINIRADLPGSGTIQFDKNGCGTPNAFGDASFCTLMFFSPIDVTFDKLVIEDPSKKGRKVYQIKGNLPQPSWKYFLIAPASESGVYRLVIEDGSTTSGPGGAVIQKRRVVTLEQI